MKLTLQELWHWFNQHDLSIQRKRRWGGKFNQQERKLIQYVMEYTRLKKLPEHKPKTPKQEPPPPKPKKKRQQHIFSPPRPFHPITEQQITTLINLGVPRSKCDKWSSGQANQQIKVLNDARNLRPIVNTTPGTPPAPKAPQNWKILDSQRYITQIEKRPD